VVQEAISQKFIKEEDLSYNIVFQHWLWQFIPGIFLNPLMFVMPKYLGNMGQICVDGTNVIGSTDDGAPYQQIQKPGLPDSLNENPPIAYGMALIQCLTWIYNLHINYLQKIFSCFQMIFQQPFISSFIT